MNSFTIGTLARQTGLGIETIRYYERRGLLPPADRGSSGYRQFGPQHVQRLRRIASAKRLGFTLREIGELIDRVDMPGSRCADLREIAHEKLREIDEKITALEALRGDLRRALAGCDPQGAAANCRILTNGVRSETEAG